MIKTALSKLYEQHKDFVKEENCIETYEVRFGDIAIGECGFWLFEQNLENSQKLVDDYLHALEISGSAMFSLKYTADTGNVSMSTLIILLIGKMFESFGVETEEIFDVVQKNTAQ